MKITNRINNLKVGEILKEGNCNDYILFEKYVPQVKVYDAQINMTIMYGNIGTFIKSVENGITDEQLGEAMEELKERHLRNIDTIFHDFNRYNCGNKFNI